MTEPEKISHARLLAWARGQLAEEEARAIEERVAEAELLAFAEFGDDAILSSPPSEVMDGLIDRFEVYAEDRRGPGVLRRLVATLAFDSGAQPAAGLRSAGTQGLLRQLVYSTDAADVSLNIRPHRGSEGLVVNLQVFPLGDAEPNTFRVRLLGGEGEVSAAADELGRAVFEPVSPGVYDVLVSGGEVEISLPSVALGP